MNYLYELKVYGGEDGEDEIVKVSGFSEESILEGLRKVDHAIKKYEAKQEEKANALYENWKENGDSQDGHYN